MSIHYQVTGTRQWVYVMSTMVYGAMLAKSCWISQGHPLSRSRSRAMMVSRSLMSGVAVTGASLSKAICFRRAELARMLLIPCKEQPSKLGSTRRGVGD